MEEEQIPKGKNFNQIKSKKTSKAWNWTIIQTFEIPRDYIPQF